MIRVGIAGGAGYTGGELIRLLLHHPNVQIIFVQSTSNAGHPLFKVHTDLVGDTDIHFTDQISFEIDVLFLCMGHGEARQFLAKQALPPQIKVIDLSQDFRLHEQAYFNEQKFVYGLPELNRSAIAEANYIANPGCFATAIQLGLLPLAKAGVLGDIYTTGITGSTGAGQSLSSTSHFSWRANNIEAYKSLTHQHIHEITASLNQLQSDNPMSANGNGIGLHFVPWRGDFTRGIYVSSTIDIGLPFDALVLMYQEFYADAAFTFVTDKMINLKQVVNTNKCLIHLEKQGNKLVIHSAIDNLLKGASGQAVQNMNLVFGLHETTGLQLKASYF